MESNKEQKEKKKKKVSPRAVIGIIIILAGIGVFLYPICVQAYNKHEQEKMIAEIKAEILANMAEQNNAGDEEDTGDTGAGEEEQRVTPAPTKAAVPEDEEPQKTPDEKPEPTSVPDNEILGDALAQVTDAPDDEDVEEATKPNRLSGRKVIGLIEIEAIDLFYPIVEGTETEDIGVAIGHMTNTAELGAIGNCALAGHRGGYSGPYFKKLDKLKAGDKVVITNAQGTEFVYKVTESMVVEPTEVWVVEDTGEDKAILTLVTCEEDGTKRLIVRCELE